MSMLRSSFSMKQTKPRQASSRSAAKFTVEELVREFGPQSQSIDARVGDQRLVYDISQAEWTSGSTYEIPVGDLDHDSASNLDGVTSKTPPSSREVAMLEKTKSRLVEENNKLREKVDVLLEMLAEATAEYDIRRNH